MSESTNSSQNTTDSSSRPNPKIIKVEAEKGKEPYNKEEIQYKNVVVKGVGTFGKVYKAEMCHSKELIAIKTVPQNPKYINRELEIMRSLDHINIVKLLYSFCTYGPSQGEVFLNLILEYMPETIHNLIIRQARMKRVLPINCIRIYMYQLLRSLAYLHSKSICHRDIKPQNLLIDPESGVVKLCDFGTAKSLVDGEKSISYVCSRHYRAPELLFGATRYNHKIDIWSAGCILGEFLLGRTLFPGKCPIDQIVHIVKVLGTPTEQDIQNLNPDFQRHDFTKIDPVEWTKLFRSRTPPDAVDLISKLLIYTPAARPTPLQACAHQFFDELRQVPQKLPNRRDLPPLFNFTEYELSIEPSLNDRLKPKWTTNDIKSITKE